MPEDTSLQDLVVGYARQVGGLVEGPAYGVYEILLPESAAARWGVDPYLRLSFGLQAAGEGIKHLYYGHPLVDAIVSDLRQQPTNTRLFINPTRIEKPGLSELLEKTLVFPNARTAAKGVQRTRLYHYICFNFKASLISDEKRELILPLWMHLQGGYRVQGNEVMSQAPLDVENEFPNQDPALPTWRALKQGESPLSPEILTALLERACTAILDEINPTLEAIQRRSQHFLELDKARLEGYYNDLRRDLEKRLVKAEVDRRPSLESKLAVLQAERQAKLADVEQKYHMRVDLELINLAIIAQPKIELDVVISKRTATTTRTAAWDPLLHRFDRLVCDVCGQPGESLHLCETGHLAHAGCLAQQCVDCKRTYCLLCSDKVHHCVVCDAPVCVRSLVNCKTCGRETCHQHSALCHAANGEPQRLAPVTAASAEREPVTPAPPLPVQEKSSKPPRHKPEKAQPKKPAPVKPARPSKAVIGQRIEVELELGQMAITAFVMKKDRQIAARHWVLIDEGIYVQCSCEKGLACPVDGLVYRPLGPDHIEDQLYNQIYMLAEEYQVPEKKISYWRIIAREAYPERHFKPDAKWKNQETLDQAQKGFDRSLRR